MPKKTIPANLQNAEEQAKTTGIYVTHALADAKTVEAATNVSKPSDENVAEARAWVNHNEK